MGFKKVSLVLSVVSCVSVFSQDYLLKNNFTDIEKVRDAKVLEISNSVASMVSINKIIPVDSDASYNQYMSVARGAYSRQMGNALETLLNKAKVVGLNIAQSTDAGMCSDFEYREQPVLSNCSGSLVGPDLILTAGHCVKIADFCDRFKWVFDYKIDSTNPMYDNYLGVNPVRSRDQIYSCKKVVKKIHSKIPIYGAIFRTDIALVQLDRRVEGRKVLEMDFAETHDKADEIFMLSYPLGLPQKFSEGLVVEKVTNAITMAMLPAMAGSSGAPVFSSKTGKIIGVLTRGGETTKLDEENKCEAINYDVILKQGYSAGIAPLRKIENAFQRYQFKN